MRLLAAALLALAAPAVGAAQPVKDVNDPARKLEGTYEVVAATADGKSDPRRDDVKAVVIVDGEIVIAGKRPEKVKFTLEPSQKPAQIDLLIRSRRVPGIYEAKDTDKGLELTIAFVRDGAGPRPKDFKGEGDGAVVLKLLRKK